MIADKPTFVVLAGCGRGEEIPVMRRVWRGCKIVGIEPLNEHWRVMGHNECEPDVFIRGAVWHTSGETLNFQLNYEPDQRATIYRLPIELPGAITREIRTVTLDEVVERHGPLPPETSILWMDIEGGEFEALRASQTIADAAFRWINLEVSFTPARIAPPWFHTIEVLQTSGYRLFGIHSVSKSGRQCDAVFLRATEWEARNRDTTDRSVRRKLERLAAGRGRVQGTYRHPEDDPDDESADQ